MSKFNIGDRVRCINSWEDNYNIVGLGGKIVGIKINEREITYAVEYDKEFVEGHDCSGKSREFRGWWTGERCLRLANKKKIKPFGIVKFCKEKYGV